MIATISTVEAGCVAVQEFADFLGRQPPFDGLDADDLARVAARVEVEYFAAGAVVVAEDAPRLDHLWVVRTGALDVVDRGRVVDLLGPGDMFGHVPLLAGLPPQLGLRAHEESLCLRTPIRARTCAIPSGSASPPSTPCPGATGSPRASAPDRAGGWIG